MTAVKVTKPKISNCDHDHSDNHRTLYRYSSNKGHHLDASNENGGLWVKQFLGYDQTGRNIDDDYDKDDQNDYRIFDNGITTAESNK